jgi:hypothetical protein
MIVGQVIKSLLLNYETPVVGPVYKKLGYLGMKNS